MQKSVGAILGMLMVCLGMLSCSPKEPEKEADRSIIQKQQWQADSLAARKLLEQLYPDSTARLADSLVTDSLKQDSLGTATK